MKCGKSKISVKTKDSDVMVILLGFMTQFLEISKDAEIFADYNSGNARQFIFIDKSYKKWVRDFCLALPFFHCFYGADATSCFCKV